ncbi:MAG: DUF5654 family protein [Candidatus Pacearchaeota archaeon]
MDILKTSRSFRTEFKRQVRLALVAAIGFTIAFAWRNAVFDAFESYVSRLMDIPLAHYMTEIYTAIAITLVGVIVILFTSKLLKEG